MKEVKKARIKLWLILNVIVNILLVFNIFQGPTELFKGIAELGILTLFIPCMLIVQGAYIYLNRPFKRNLTYYLLVVLLGVNIALPIFVAGLTNFFWS
jgi:hypothetical protein